MQRKPGFPMVNCNIKMPDGMPVTESVPLEEDGDGVQRRQQLINFGHAQWGFNNWSWSVTKQDLDFVEFANGKHCAGVASFVSITVKTLDIHRENVGYATCVAPHKGAAIYKSRKTAVTNALRETLLSFGGAVAAELLEQESARVATPEPPRVVPSVAPVVPSVAPVVPPVVPVVPPVVPVVPPVVPVVPPVAPVVPPVARAAPMPATTPLRPPAPVPPPPAAVAVPARPPPRPNSNECRLESMNEEEARAERKRRQQRAQEEFRLRQLKHKSHDEKQELQQGTSFDRLLMDIPTQDIEIEQTGDGQGKRKSPEPDHGAKRRISVINKLDIRTE